MPKIVLCAALALLVAAPLAFAADLTRDQYVAQVEPICKKNTNANSRILKHARQRIKKGKLKVASKQFARASTAFAKTIKKLDAVPKPTADTAKLTKWIKYLKKEQKILKQMSKALKQGKKGKTSSLNNRLSRNTTQANNAVLGFGFKECKINPSKFS